MRFGKQKTDSVVGLEIEAGSIAATEVRTNGAPRVVGSAVAPLEPGAFHEGEIVDRQRLADGLRTLFAENKLSKRVRLGLASHRVVVRTLRMPAIEDPDELRAAVRFQAQEQLPMPLDEAVLEQQLVGGVAPEEDASPKVDVMVVAVRRDLVSDFVETMRDAGLEPMGVDLSAFAMIRALGDSPSATADEGEPGSRPRGAILYCSVGDVTNLAVARARSCLFTRVSHAGLEPVATRLGTTRGLTAEHAAQWMTHVGLDAPLESVPGDADTVAETRGALEDGVSALMDELRLSLDYYGAQEGALSVERLVLCGPGSMVPGLAPRMEEGLKLPVAVSRPAALEGLDDATSARLTLPYGLALEE